jgi:hypothetical protein
MFITVGLVWNVTLAENVMNSTEKDKADAIFKQLLETTSADECLGWTK